MPVQYVIDKERRLVITTARDRVAFAEGRAHQERLKEGPSVFRDGLPCPETEEKQL